jgi:hypothetical protein
MVHRMPSEYRKYRPSKTSMRRAADTKIRNSISYIEMPEDAQGYFEKTYEKYLNEKKPYNNMGQIISHHYL